MLFEIILGIAALLLLVGGAMLFLRVMRREAQLDGEVKRKRRQSGQTTGEFGLGCAGIIAIGVVVLGVVSIHPVDAGFVGVVTSGGKVQADTLKPGFNFLPPLLYGVTNVDTRVHGIPFGQDEKARFGAASREYQDVFLQGTLNIHIDQDKAVDLYQKVGLDYDQKLVVPFFSTTIKEIVPRYAIGDILANREEIRKLTVAKLQEKLAPYGIVVDDVAISNIDFSDAYKQAIEAKQVAEQQVQTETQILAQKKIQADQVRAAAQGVADATAIQAKGQAEANRLINESLTPLLIQYTAIARLNPNVQTIYLPEGSNFFLNAPPTAK